ncbi:MAG: hypothetical protein IH584_00350, partial [Candidatus Aminicenantes bacterium]|nr:hypothetical protein [Candidatus Aminicenantes bacterium]
MAKQAKLVFLSIWLLGVGVQAQKSEFPKLSGPYLGQKPPGLTPKIFAPGIVSSKDNYEFKIAFTPDGKEIYFT